MTDFRINVIIDPAQARTGARAVDRELTSVGNSADRLDKLLRRAFTFAGIAYGIKQLADLADAFTNIQNRLGTVVEGEQELTKVTAELLAIADRTRSSFQGTAELFARVGLSARELGVDQKQLLQFTESLNQAIILSGASSTEASAGLIQLSQGLASGALRGDELRSVLEQLPAVADVISKSLGVTRGELRKLGADGKITADTIITAFAEAREELDTRFAKTVPTLGQAFTVLKNNLIAFVGELNGVAGVTGSLAEAITFLAKNLKVLSITAAAAAAAFAFKPLAEAAQKFYTAAKASLEFNAAIKAGNAVLLGSSKAIAQQAAFAAEQAAATAAGAETAAVARVQSAQAAVAAAKAENALALVTFESTAAGQAKAQSDLLAAAAGLRRTSVTVAAAEAEQALALASGESTAVLTAALINEPRLVAIRATLLAETQALTAAQTALAASSQAAGVAASIQAGQQARLVALEAELAASTAGLATAQAAAASSGTALAAAQTTAAAAGTGLTGVVSGLTAAIGRLWAFILANPIGVVVALFLVLAAALVDFKAQMEIVKGGFAELFGLIGRTGVAIGNFAKSLTGMGAGLTSVVNGLGSVGLLLVAVAATNPFVALAAAIGSVVLALGTLTAELEKFHEALRIADEGSLTTFGKIGDRILATQKQIKSLQAVLAQDPGNQGAIAHLQRAEAALAKLRGESKKYSDQANKQKEAQLALTPSFDKLIADLDREAQLLQLSSREREVQNKLIAAEQKLKAAGVDITDQQRAELQARIENIQAMTEENKILEELRGPQLEHEERYRTLKKLLDEARISQEEFNRAMQSEQPFGPEAPEPEKATSIPKDFQFIPDPDKFNVALAQLDKERELIGLSNQERAIQNQLLSTEEQLRNEGRVLTEAELSQLEEKIRLNQQLSDQKSSEMEVHELLFGQQERELRLLQAAKRMYDSGAISAADYAKALEKIKTSQEKVAEGSELMNGAIDILGNALNDLAKNGTASFDSLKDAILQDIAELLAQQAIKGILNLIGGAAGGGWGAIFGSIAGSIAGRAEGGPVYGGRPYIVGEQGPELFIPPHGGNIVPNDATQSMLQGGAVGGTTVIQAPAPNVNVSVVNVTDQKEALSALDTPDGQKKVLNVINKNRTSVKRSLS